MVPGKYDPIAQVSSLLSLSCQRLKTAGVWEFANAESCCRRDVMDEGHFATEGLGGALSQIIARAGDTRRSRGVRYCSTCFIIDLPGNVHK
jgi:hypothetical protein